MYTNCGCSGYGQDRGAEPLVVEGFVDTIFPSVEHAEQFRMDSIRTLRENGITVQVSTVQETPEGFMVYLSLIGAPETADLMPSLVSPFAGPEAAVPEKKSAVPVILVVGGVVGLLGVLIYAVGK